MSETNPYKPPRVAETFLLLLLPKENGELILGDLREEFARVVSKHGGKRAQMWYWNQAFSRWSYLDLTFLKLQRIIKLSRGERSLDPAKFSVSILKLILPVAKAENVLGDLDETYRERVRESGLNASLKWYRKQVRASIWEFIREAIKDQLFSWIGRRVR